jgi:hypothetical protein
MWVSLLDYMLLYTFLFKLPFISEEAKEKEFKKIRHRQILQYFMAG